MAFTITQPKRVKPWKEVELREMLKWAGKLPLEEVAEKVNLAGGNKRTSSAVEARGNKNGIQFGMKKAS